jgi:hypothetical protein
MGVDYFPCDRCKTIICDCGPFKHCSCGKAYCTECANELKTIYPKPDDESDDLDDLDDDELYQCHHCNKDARIKIIRQKIKKLKEELVTLEYSVLKFD